MQFQVYDVHLTENFGQLSIPEIKTTTTNATTTTTKIFELENVIVWLQIYI